MPELVGVRQPAMLLVNDDDLTYCKQRLDEDSFATLRNGGIAKLETPLARTLCWSAAWDMTRDGELAGPATTSRSSSPAPPTRPTSASCSR